MNHLVVVDDDPGIRELLSAYLTKNGYQVASFGSAEEFLENDAVDQDLLVLDVGLPGMDGLELCRQIRARSDVPIIMLTAACDDVDRILGLELGADDYLGKPFNPRELLARIKALLRRSKPTIESEPSSLRIDAAKRKVWYRGAEVVLTGAEFTLLQALAKHEGEIVSRDDLSIEVKGHPASPYDRSIDTLISRLRAKLSPVIEGEPIQAVRGRGYQLVLP